MHLVAIALKKKKKVSSLAFSEVASVLLKRLC